MTNNNNQKTLNLLLVEDTPFHIEAAKIQLEGHNLTVVSQYTDAIATLKKQAEHNFDMLLTDLFIPYSKTPEYPIQHLGSAVSEKPEALGFQIALYGKVLAGIEHVAIMTDVNHHDGPVCATIDDFSTQHKGDQSYKGLQLFYWSKKQYLIALGRTGLLGDITQEQEKEAQEKVEQSYKDPSK